VREVARANDGGVMPHVLNVNVPFDAVPDKPIHTVASSGAEVVFTLPAGVPPGTAMASRLSSHARCDRVGPGNVCFVGCQSNPFTPWATA